MSFVALTPLAYSSAGFLRDFDGTYHALNEYTGKGKWLIVMICQAGDIRSKTLWMILLIILISRLYTASPQATPAGEGLT